jgi:hypothetical protein
MKEYIYLWALLAGKESFQGRSLHALSSTSMNPYEQAISIIGRTLSPFDDDNLIPCFGFGDGNFIACSGSCQSDSMAFPLRKICSS